MVLDVFCVQMQVMRKYFYCSTKVISMSMKYPAEEWIPIVFGDAVFHNTVTQVMSHPSEAPSLTELHYFAPSTNNSVINNAVDRLIEVGILQEVGEQPFIGFTERGKQFTVDSKLYRGENILKSVYMQTKISEDVHRVADMPRPDWYLEDIAGREFEEDTDARDTQAFTNGWDRVMYPVKLTVGLNEDGTALIAVFERSDESSFYADEEDVNYEVVTETIYALSKEEQEEVKNSVSFPIVADGSEGIMNISSDNEDYSIEFDVFVGESETFDTYYSVLVKTVSGKTVVSTYIDPSISFDNQKE